MLIVVLFFSCNNDNIKESTKSGNLKNGLLKLAPNEIAYFYSLDFNDETQQSCFKIAIKTDNDGNISYNKERVLAKDVFEQIDSVPTLHIVNVDEKYCTLNDYQFVTIIPEDDPNNLFTIQFDTSDFYPKIHEKSNICTKYYCYECYCKKEGSYACEGSCGVNLSQCQGSIVRCTELSSECKRWDGKCVGKAEKRSVEQKQYISNYYGGLLLMGKDLIYDSSLK